MAVQLAGYDPEVIAAAARLNQERGAALIDINMGCPVKKVVNKQCGSALMRDERLHEPRQELRLKLLAPSPASRLGEAPLHRGSAKLAALLHHGTTASRHNGIEARCSTTASMLGEAPVH